MEQAIVGVLLLGGIVALVVKKLKKKKEAEDEDEAEDAAFDAIDTNRDGRISAKEEFAALDTNKDGKISAEEEQGRSKVAAVIEQRKFKDIDTNKDGKISAEEEFNALDTNKDGQISANEEKRRKAIRRTIQRQKSVLNVAKEELKKRTEVHLKFYQREIAEKVKILTTSLQVGPRAERQRPLLHRTPVNGRFALDRSAVIPAAACR